MEISKVIPAHRVTVEDRYTFQLMCVDGLM